jgi:hypothetical protein
MSCTQGPFHFHISKAKNQLLVAGIRSYILKQQQRRHKEKLKDFMMKNSRTDKQMQQM